MSLDQAPPPDDPSKGWKVDPLGSGSEREWDGEKWTQNIRGKHKKRLEGKSLLLVVGIASAIVGGLIGYAGAAGEKDDANQRADELQQQKVELQQKLDEADSSVEMYEDELDSANARAAKAKAKAAQKVASLNSREKSLDAREAKISETEATIKHNTFGDGIWQVGVDFDSGTYRSEGGSGCYWALLNSADTSDILNNGGFSANQTVTIDSAWFETNGCGEWTKIG